MSLKPIILWGYEKGPNPWKVAMILEELHVPYTLQMIDFPDMKKEPFESINPNGRVPAIEDPNTAITLWESGAIIEYLVETYDTQPTISSAPGSKQYYEEKQWLYFQVSGQGPYFGQAVWFTAFHAEKLPSVIARYVDEVVRVSGVLNRALKDKKWLVGDRLSYADVSFVTWYGFIFLFAERINLEVDFPRVHAWLERMKNRPAVGKIWKAQEAAIAASK